MTESKKTMIFGAVALALMLLAFITTPGKVTPDAFLDQGEPFFPEFEDPNTAASLEVVGYNEETGEAVPFKVINNGGKWSIPSHHDYPADGKERLAKTAAGVIGIKKDDFRSNNASDHEACGVIDPLDETEASLTGRGTRVTLKGANDQVLADFIVGKEVENREGFRFVRIPGQKLVYSVRMDIDLSTKFSDWIESDLLSVNKDAITEITLKDYSINERSGTINQRDEIALTKNGGNWNINKLPGSKEVDKTKVDELAKNLDELSIVGVRPKPAGISKSLQKISEEGGIEISQGDYLSLRSKGYFFVGGRLLSNEGEVETRTKDGVVYTLRFGEVAYGSGFDVSAGLDGDAAEAQKDIADNRYLFITAYFDDAVFPEPAAPQNVDFLNKADSLWTDTDRSNKSVYDAHESWRSKVEKGQGMANALKDRFAGWYYVISDESFKKLSKKRSDLIKDKS